MGHANAIFLALGVFLLLQVRDRLTSPANISFGQ
jgi:hypothetical protein